MTVTAPVVRRLTDADADAMADLATLCEIAETGEPDPEVVDWIHATSGTEPFRAFGIDDTHGLAAFGYVECAPGHTGLTAEVRVRPGLDLDLGVPLLQRVTAAAVAFDPSKPLHSFTNAGAARQRQWWEAQGASVVRHFWRMTIDLDGEQPSVPPAADGVTLRHVHDDDADLRQVFDIVEESFGEHFGHSGDGTFDSWIDMWRRRTGFELSLWWVAELHGDPIAVLLGQTLGGEGYVGTLGTLAQGRGRGIATLLLRTSFAEFHDRGLRRVSLGVDSENTTGAVALYEKVGMHPTAEWALYELPPLG